MRLLSGKNAAALRKPALCWKSVLPRKTHGPGAARIVDGFFRELLGRLPAAIQCLLLPAGGHAFRNDNDMAGMAL